MGRLVGALRRKHYGGVWHEARRIIVPLNKSVYVEFGGSLISGSGYVADEVIVPRQSLRPVLCMLQLPAMPGKVGTLMKTVTAERYLETLSFFDGSRGSSLPGQKEAAVTHLQGSMGVSEYPNMCKAVPNCSTAFDYQLDLSCVAVKKIIHFNGSDILGGTRQCQQNLWTASWKQLYFRYFSQRLLSFLTVGRSSRNLFLS